MDAQVTPELAALKSTTFSGRRVSRRQLEEVRWTVENTSHQSRNDLARTICEHLNWRTHRGSDKVMACLAMLETLERQGLLKLPPKKENMVRKQPAGPVWGPETDPQPEIVADLAELRPVRLQPAESREDRQLWNALVDRHHYIRYRKPFGSHIRYFILDGSGRRLGGLLFEDCTQDLPARDRWVGWSTRKRDRNRHMLLVNSRFLILPWVKVKNLASHALGLAAARLADDWQERFRIRPVLCETFVDEKKFSGTCYRAASWVRIGETAGGKKKTPKAIHVLPLDRDWKDILCGNRDNSKPKKRLWRRARPVSSDHRFLTQWTRLIEAATPVAARHDAKWQKRRRTWSSLLIILFVFRRVLADRSLGYDAVLSELWDNCLDAGMAMPSERPPVASTATNAREKLDEEAFREVHQTMLAAVEEARSCQAHRIFAVDGSRINLPKELLKNGYRLPNADSHYPQGLVSTLYRLHSKIPVDFELHADASERTAALRHIDWLLPDDIVVYDNGYFSFQFLDGHLRKGVKAVFRIQRNTHPIFDDFITSGEAERTIDLPTPKDGPPEFRGQARRLRLLTCKADDIRFTVATTLSDPIRYTASDIAELYRDRWSVAEIYEVSKGLQFSGRSERGVRQELFANLALVVLTQLVANRCEIESVSGPDKTIMPPSQAAHGL